MVRQPASQRAVAQNEINKDNMKIIRNIARRPWPRIGGWLPVMMLICGVLASCSSEDESTAPLPDGKYPLQLTAEVAQPQTRAEVRMRGRAARRLECHWKACLVTKHT